MKAKCKALAGLQLVPGSLYDCLYKLLYYVDSFNSTQFIFRHTHLVIVRSGCYQPADTVPLRNLLTLFAAALTTCCSCRLVLLMLISAALLMHFERAVSAARTCPGHDEPLLTCGRQPVVITCFRLTPRARIITSSAGRKCLSEIMLAMSE